MAGGVTYGGLRKSENVLEFSLAVSWGPGKSMAFFNMTSLSVSKRSQKEIVRQTLMWETEVVRLRASVGGKQATFLT